MPTAATVVQHKLLISMDGQSVAFELRARWKARRVPNRGLCMTHDSECVNLHVAAVVKTHNLIDIKTRARHPEPNGIVERFNETVRRESDYDYGENYPKADAIIAGLMRHYNDERLTRSLGLHDSGNMAS